MAMNVSESHYLRLHHDSSSIGTLHRSLGQVRGAIYSQEERGNYLLIIFGMAVLFVFVFLAVNTRCDYGSSTSNETSDDPLPSPDPKRRAKIEENLFCGKVNTTLKPRSNTLSASVFQPRQPANDEECTICCNHFFLDEAYCIVKSCNHAFHNACIEQWIFDQQKDICPVCRQKVTIDDDGCKEIEMVSSREGNQPGT